MNQKQSDNSDSNQKQSEKSDGLNKWVGLIGSVIALATTIITAFIWPDPPIIAYVCLGITLILALWIWWIKLRRMPPEHEFWTILFKGIVLLLIIVLALGTGYWLWWGWQTDYEVIIFSALLGVVSTLAFIGWWWTLRPKPLVVKQKTLTVVLMGVILLLILVIALGLGYWVWWRYEQISQPRFEITALDTLEDDKNAYEVTDQLIWNQNNLDKYGVSITFTLEVRPNYFGKQRFGKVIAQISGDSGDTLEKILWDDFTSSASTQEIQLTLPDLLSISDLKINSKAAHNLFRAGEIDYQQTTITVEIARLADKLHPWAKEKIVIRNAPWDTRATLTERNNRREADVYVKNLGGTGEFSVHYRLVQLKNRLDTSTIPENNGAININTWNEPTELVRLEPGAFFTGTVAIPDQAERGRYLLEVYTVKKQNYIKFDDPASKWEDLDSLQIPWWFGGHPPTRLIFVVPLPEIGTVDIIQAEVDRLRNEEGIDLGLPVEPLEEITSSQSTVGQHQLFQDGEVYVNDGQAYALYGPILEHYNKLGGVEHVALGFPISSIKVVTSSSGITGTMMEFEGSSAGPSAIYASKKGIAATWPWISQVYSQDQGGHSGWLGFPLTDEQYYTDSTSQIFEGGYVVYYFPYVGEKRDWDRLPVAYPYLASRGALFEVQAHQGWQNTGIQLQAGSHITIIQVDGSWSYVGEAFFDANGDPNADIAEEHREILMLPSSYVATLVGRIGENNDRIFPVGRWSEFTADTEGTLYLAMNDIDHQDNAGAITVEIMVESAATE